MSDELKDGLMLSAWLGCISWASHTPEVVQRFTQETGATLSFPTSPIEAAIDKATGFDKQQEVDSIKFIRWVTETLWGVEYAPKAYHIMTATYVETEEPCHGKRRKPRRTKIHRTPTRPLSRRP